MKSIHYKKNKKVVMAILMTLLLTACAQKNPLINDDFIQDMKGKMSLNDDTQFPIVMCSAFYANHASSPAEINQCAAWSNAYYQDLLSVGDIANNVTLANFRDPKLWQAILKH